MKTHYDFGTSHSYEYEWTPMYAHRSTVPSYVYVWDQKITQK